MVVIMILILPLNDTELNATNFVFFFKNVGDRVKSPEVMLFS